MSYLPLFLAIMGAWHLMPGWDVFPWYVWIGPHDPTLAFCYIDTTLDKAHVGDLPRCLMILQNLERLDLAQRFQQAENIQK